MYVPDEKHLTDRAVFSLSLPPYAGVNPPKE